MVSSPIPASVLALTLLDVGLLPGSISQSKPFSPEITLGPSFITAAEKLE